MGSDPESDPNTIPKLPLFSLPLPPHLSEPSGMLTPPLYTSASVPFRWEEQPGKPRPCTDIIIAAASPYKTCLDLPPRLAMMAVESGIITKTSSPTTVLDGKSVFSSSSFRFAKERRRIGQMQGSSFDSNGSGGWSSPSDENSGGQLLLLPAGNRISGGRGYCRFGSFRRRRSSSAAVTCFSDEKNGKTMRRDSSVSKVTRSHFWATIYKGFKEVIPWRKKSKKESFTL
ncbi:hypothetical protein SSX86_028023 [Deinandra increscens subsp. villosa]|uniref:Uncharacterized protein n=1 Tax=Deinandra increscens subsp. villosa TaxID=3103831 RepID=A0AAP0C8K8_9ASTR